MKSISALGWLGVGLFLTPLWHDLKLLEDAVPTGAEIFCMASGFLLVAIDAATQRHE